MITVKAVYVRLREESPQIANCVICYTRALNRNSPRLLSNMESKLIQRLDIKKDNFEYVEGYHKDLYQQMKRNRPTREDLDSFATWVVRYWYPSYKSFD